MAHKLSNSITSKLADAQPQISNERKIWANRQDTPMPSPNQLLSPTGDQMDVMDRAAAQLRHVLEAQEGIFETGAVPISSATITGINKEARTPTRDSKGLSRKTSTTQSLSKSFQLKGSLQKQQSRPLRLKLFLKKIMHSLRRNELFLGDFAIVSNHGEGGEARLFMARPRRRIGIYAKMPHFVVLRMTSPRSSRGETRERAAIRIHNLVKDHPNTVNTYGTFEAEGKIVQVLEPLFGGTIQEAVFRRDLGPPMRGNERLALHVMKQVFSALKHMHERGFSHGDVAADNIMIEQPNWNLEEERLPKVKLIDFGFATEWNTKYPESAQSTLRVSKMGYTPAEVYFSPSFSRPSVDVHAAGVTFYLIITGQGAHDINYAPDSTLENEVLMKYGGISYQQKIWETISPATRSVIEDCLQQDPAKRPSAAVAEYRVKDALALLTQAGTGNKT